DHAGEEALLAGVAAEDVREAAREDDLEAVVLERPHGVLTRGAGAEVGAGHEDRARRVLGLVEDEFGVAAPRREQRVLEARAGHALEVDGGDDLVGVDVRATQRDADAGVGRELLHGSSFASVATPVPIRTRPRPRGRPGWTRCRAPRWPPRR